MALLVVEHARFGAPRTFSFLAPDFLDSLHFRSDGAGEFRLNFVEQNSPRQKAIERLGALLLAFNPDAGRAVHEQHAGGNLVDVLPAGARGANELLVDIALPHAESLHALGELFLFVA